MNIQIQFIDVSVEDKGKYKMAEVTFKDLAKGQTSSKKLMSFSNPVVYKTLVDAKKGEVYTIEMQKNDKGFWDWIAASIANSVNAGSAGSPEPTTKASGSTSFTSPKSTYETPEERAKKQVYIVRQSSISAAIDTLKTDKKNPTKEEVVATAQFYESFVFGVDVAPPKLADLPTFEDEEDVPL
jgi:hypothetical protein